MLPGMQRARSQVPPLPHCARLLCLHNVPASCAASAGERKHEFCESSSPLWSSTVHHLARHVWPTGVKFMLEVSTASWSWQGRQKPLDSSVTQSQHVTSSEKPVLLSLNGLMAHGAGTKLRWQPCTEATRVQQQLLPHDAGWTFLMHMCQHTVDNVNINQHGCCDRSCLLGVLCRLDCLSL
jgi:hypothetical protein